LIGVNAAAMNRIGSFFETTDRWAARLALAVAVAIAPHIVWPAGCIPSGTEADINAALSGPGSRAVLCPKATFRLSHRIVLSSDGQQLFTEGLPTDDSRARIEVTDGSLSTAIFSRASNISVHHLIVDGARARYGRDPKGEALIDLGGDVSGISVDHVRAFDPRGWSVLHVFEGRRDCSGARITYNDIGPSGHPNHEWADGISFACRSGFIQHNTITDASDGGIVIFGAPGTLVEDNLIVTRSNTLLGGINMVDYGPFDGDYTGTIVRHNRIQAPGGYIKIAIAAGPVVWGERHGRAVRGAEITDNSIVGDNIGFGIAADDVADFTIAGNRAQGRFGGVRGDRCWPDMTLTGSAFIRNPASTSGTFQKEFEAGFLGYAICIKKSPDDPN
jgi:Right handed beta helix region